jgi:hypothetical protein
MVITALDSYELVKQLRGAGFTDAQAEMLTTVLRKSQDVDLSHLATKDDIAALAASTKADLAETKAEIFRVLLGHTLVIIGAVVALLKLSGH